MSFGKKFWDLFVKRFVEEHKPGEAPHNRKRSLQVETLEVREMLSGISIVALPSTVDEGQTAIIRIEREDTQGDLSAFFELDYRNSACSYENYAGWAKNGKDFDFLPGTSEWNYQGHVEFLDGQQYVDIAINAKTDAFLEGDEQISLRLINYNNYWGDRAGVSSNTTYTIDQDHSSTTMTIKDTTAPTTVWVAEVQNAVENGTNGSVRLERDNVENALTVYFKLDSRNSGYYYYTNQNPAGWARNGTDFEWLPGTDQYNYESIGHVTFAAGERFADISFQVKDDNWIEGTEQVGLTLHQQNGCYYCSYGQEITYNLDSERSSATILIEDDEPIVNVWIDETQNASEDGTNGFFRLKRDNVDRELTVYYRLDDRNAGCYYCYYNEINGWASSGQDFEYLPGTESWHNYGRITFAVGVDTVDIPIVVKDDTKAEGTENVRITLTEYDYYYGNQGGVAYHLDTTRSTATLAIHDNEAPINVWIAGVQNATENSTHGYFQLERSSSVGRMQVFFQFDPNNMGTVPEGWAKAGDDFNWPNSWPCSVNTSTGFGYVYFEDGQTTVNIPIQWRNDNWIEGTEQVAISLVADNGDGRGEVFQIDPSMGFASLSIIDDEVPVTVRIEKIQDGAEGGDSGIFRIHRDVSTQALTVWFELNTSNSYYSANTFGWATNGRDFNYLSGTNYNNNRGSVNFAAGQDYVDIEVKVIEDGRMEGPEKVELTLSPNTSGLTYFIDETQKTASLEIADNEEIIRVWISEIQDGIEGVQDGYVRLERDDATTELRVWFQFDKNRGYDNNFGWARNGVDFAYLPNTNQYSNRGYVTFAAGATTIDIPIAVTDDNWVEGTEQIQIKLVQEYECYYCYGCGYNDEGVKYLLDPATSTATVNIEDNETPVKVWIDETGDAQEGSHDGFITLKRSHTEGALTVWFQLDSRNGGCSYCSYNYEGWAGNGRDFEFLPGTNCYYNYGMGSVTFEDGQDTLTIPITVKDDIYIEGDEKIGFTLVQRNNNEPAYLFDDERKSTTVTIHDNEESITVWVGEIQNAKEGEQDGYIRIYRDNAYRALEVSFELNYQNGAYPSYNYKGHAKNGVDFVMLPGTTTNSNRGKIMFDEGQYFVDIPITVIDDELHEGTESVKVTLVNENGGGCCYYCYYSQGVSYLLDSSKREGTLTIEDNDAPINVWIETVQNAVEGSQDGYVRLRRDNFEKAVTVYYSIDGRNIGSDSSQCYYCGYQYTLGWAKNGIDFQMLPGTSNGGNRGSITFAEGQEYIDIPITLLEDLKVEGKEVVSITLLAAGLGTSGSTAYFNDTSRSSATVEIEDNDATTVWIEKECDATEGGEPGYIVIKRDNTANELTVRYGFNKKLSTADRSDFEQMTGMGPNSSMGSVTFKIGEDTIRIAINAIDDSLIEHPETIYFKLFAAPDPNDNYNGYCYYCYYREPLLPAYDVDPERESVIVTINDNDIRPKVWVDSTQDGTEGLQNGYVRVRRDDATNALRISYQINEASTATIGVDYDYPSGMSEYHNQNGFITFGAGVYYVDIPIRVSDDLEIEDTETVSITIIPGDETVGGVNTIYEIDNSRNTAIVNIFDNDTKPTVSVDYVQHGAEGGQNGYIRLKRDLSRTELTVHYILDVGSGTATMGSDFQQLPGMTGTSYSGKATFAAGQEYVYIPINVFDDNLIEGEESLRIILTSGIGNYELGENFEAIVKIADNDVMTNVWIDSVQHGHEGVRDGYVRLYRDQTGTPLTVYFEYDTNSSTAVVGEDFERFDTMPYGTNFASVTFGINDHYVDIPIGVIDDTTVEGTENILFRLHQGVDGDASSYLITGDMTALVEIADNDEAATVWIDSARDAYEGETGNVRIYRSNTAGALRVGFQFDAVTATAVFGDDFNFGGVYDPASGIGYVDFADGQEYVDLAVHALHDLLLENDETVPVKLQDSVDGQYVLTGTTAAVVTIFDTGEEEAVPDAWRVGVFATDPYASENGPNKGEFTLIRTGHSDLNQPLTVRFQISGTATLGVDYYGIHATYDAESGLWFGEYTFQAGQTHHVFTVTPLVDNLEEGTENIVITLLPSLETNSEGEPLYAVESASSATMVIEDAIKVVGPIVDPPVKVTWDVNVSATDPHASEDGTNPGEFTIVRSGVINVSQPLTVGFRITGSATMNVDYTGINATWDAATNSWVGTITFAAGQTHYVLNVTPLTDDLVEGTENVVLTLLPTEATTESGELLYALGSGTSANVNIKDATQVSDPLTDPPVRETWDISVIATDPHASEVRQNSGEFTIVRSGLTDLSKPLTVYFEISGTAAHNADYTGINITTDPVTGKLVGSVTFQANQKYVVLNITPLLDELTEGTETVVLTILSTDAVTESGQPLYAVDGTASSATVQIEDDATVEAGNPWVSGDPEIREGRTYTLDLHDNEAGVIRWEITWGDGSAKQIVDGDVTQVTHFYADGDENYTISIVAITEETVPGGGEPIGGWQGLSHGYWKNHPQDWVFFNTTDNYEAVFGVSNSQKPGSLMQAVKTGGGGIKALWRESVAALNNATHPNIAFQFSVDEIIAMVQAAYATGEYTYYKDILETENTRHNVDINNPGNNGGGSTGTTTREVRTELEKEVFVKNVAPDLTISGESKTLPNTAYVLHLSDYDPGDDTITHWTIRWGDGTETVVNGNPSEVTHIYTAVGDYTITATATDEDGTWNANTVDVRVYEPQTGLLKGTPWISGDPEILEGRTYTLDLHANEANILRWEITWGDGQTSVVDGAATQAEHFYADGDENFTISVVAVKQTESGTENVTMEQALLVLNVAPVLVISGSSKSEKDKQYLLNLSEYDPGDDTITHWTINWGDGTNETVQGNPSNVTHVYSTEGTFTITATATDEDGTWNANTVDVLVYVPEIGQNTGIPFITGDPEILEGRTYTLDLHANEANILRWEITWGDGQSSVVDGSATYVTHFYADGDETRNISVVAVKDVGGQTEDVVLEKEVLVKNVAPTLIISGPAASQPNAIYQLGLSSYDPGDDTITHWTINWGDGIVETVTGNPSLATHVYAEAGLYTITATATDEDGTWNANTLNIHVKVDAQTEWIKLVEDDRFVTDFRTTFTVTEENKAMVLDIRNLQFDGRSEGMINDAFEVALVDANGTPLVATIRTTRDGFLNITEGMENLLASGVLYDSGNGRIILDLSRLAVGTEATLIVRLVNNDVDTKTSVELNPNLSFIDSPFGAGNNMTPQEIPGHRQQIDFAHVTDVTSMIQFGYETTTFNDQKGILRASLNLTNIGSQALRGPILVAIRNITDPSVSVTGYDGRTPDGMYYFDVSHLAFSGQDGTFDPDEIIRGLDLQFLNPGHVQFQYELVVLAHINKAPTFTSTPETEITAGNEFIYDAKATDPENDTLRYEKVFGPEGMIVDAKTGRITWTTTSEHVGVHDVVIRVYDTGGLHDEQNFQINVTEWVNRPPYFTSTPETEAFVGTVYHYQATADDPDKDPLTYSLVDAFVSETGQKLTDFHATHHLTVSEDGKVTWNPPAELIGQTITVILEVQDPHGATALQEYLISIHSNKTNNPPVIITEPTTTVTLPTLEDANATGAVQPGALNLTLEAGEKTTQTVTVNIENQGLLAADIVFIVDESGSMSYGHTWIQNMVKGFEEKFGATGVNVNYALVGYGRGGSGDLGRLLYLNGTDPWGNSTQMWNACGTLQTSGGFEDGYSAIDFALNNLTFREGAAKHFILLTDEPRDVGNHAIDFESTISRLADSGVTLHGIVNAGFKDDANTTVLGGRGDGTAYAVLPGGEYDERDGLAPVANWEARTISEYVNLIFHPDIDGTCWSINELNRNDYDRSRSFTNAFVDTLVWDVLAEFEIDVVSSNPNVVIQNVTGIQSISQGKLVFEIEITGDGNAHQFDLEFINVKNGDALIGSIPCSIRTGYVYDVDAIDPDGDELLYSLVGETHGATVNPHTGVLVWDPAVPGEYTFTVRVIDGRGGEDTQTWTVSVVDPAAGNNDPTLQSVENKTIEVGASYEIPMVGNDIDNDALRYFLVMNPAEGLIYPDNIQIDRATGVIRWTPTADQVGTYKIRVQAVDGRGGSVTTDFEIKVVLPSSMINNPPEITSNPIISGTAEKTYIYQVNANDPDGHALTYKLMYGPEGMIIDSKSGTIVWTPKYNQIGEYQVVVRVSDGQGGYAHQDFILTVLSENEVPEIISKPEGPVVLNQPWQYQVVAVDPNGDPLTYLVDQASASRGMTIDANGLFTWTPTETGIYDIMILVDDGRGGQIIQAFSIEITSVAPPEITSNPSGPAFIGEEWTYAITTDQEDGTYTLELDADSIARGMVLDGDTIRWTPNAVGDASVKVTLTDQHGGKYIQTFTITAQARPVASFPPSIDSEPTGPIYVGEEWTYEVIANDPEGYNVTIYVMDDNGIPVETLQDGVLRWTPEDMTPKKFVIRAENEYGAWIEQSFTLTPIAKPVSNSAPVISSVPLGPTMVGDNYTYQVTAYDPDGDVLTYAVDEDSFENGVRIDKNTGLLTWTPATAGTQEITVIVTDSFGNARTQTFELGVNPRPIVSQPPKITSNPSGPAYVGEEWSYTISAYDPDQDSITLWLMDDAGNKIMQIDPATRTISWTPEATGDRTFTIRAEDTHGFWSEQAFTILAAARPVHNDPPVITSIPAGPAFVGERYEYRVTAYDPNGDAMMYHLDQDSIDRGITIGADGRLSWIPTASGTFAITITVRDSANNERSQSFSLPVVVRNTETPPPTFTSEPKGPAYVGQEWSYTPTATAQDGSDVTFYLVSEDGQTLTPIDVVTWTPTEAGDWTFTIRAEDANGASIDRTISITALETPVAVDPPTFTSVPTGPAYVGERYTYNVTTQTHDGSRATYSLDEESIRLGITISADGQLSWIPNAVQDAPITIIVRDASGNVVTQSFTLSVLERTVEKVPPTITSKPTGPAYVGEEWSYQLTGHATDGTSIEFYLVDDQGNVIREIENGLLTETWSAEGTQKLIVRAVDSQGTSIEQHVTIQVVQRAVETNDPPVVYSIPVEQTRLEKVYQYKVKAFDPNGDTLTYTLAKAPTGASISPDGTLSWNPSVLGDYEFTILVSDGVNDPVEHSFTVTVLAPVKLNTPPQITSVPINTAMKDREYSYQPTVIDLDGDKISWFLDDMSIPEALRHEISFDGTTGKFTWTPSVSGTFTFMIAAFDGTDYAEQTITLSVSNNAPPVITGLPDTHVEYGEEYMSQVVAHDPNGNEITYRLENAPEGLKIGADGTLTWETPILGRHNITVIVTDIEGATARRQFQLNVVDSSVPNEAPSLVGSMPGSVPVNVPFTYQLGAEDPENDPVTFRLVEGPDGMTISSNGRVEWTPNATGDVSFKVSLSDELNTVVYTCTVSVVAQRENNPPQFTSKSAESITVNKQYTYKPAAVDPDGDSVTITLVGGPTGLKMNAQGEIVWIPGSAWAGQKVSFTLRATDAYGAATDQVVELNVRSVILAPTLVMEQLPTAKINQVWTYQVKATDPQGEKVTFELVPGEYPEGMTIDAQTGVVRYTPTELPPEPYYVIWFKVRAVNESGVASNNGVFPLQVDPNSVGTPGEPGGPGGPGGYNNPAQLTLPKSHFIEAEKPWLHQIIATDLDGDTLVYTLNNPPAGMTIDSATGVISWLPGMNIIGNQYEISVTVSDGQSSPYGSFWLGIEAPNILPVIKAIPAQTVTAGTAFNYYASATDTNRTDTLTFSLDATSLALGMAINAQTGQITWKPGTERAGEAYNVTVFVTDGRDEPVSTTFELKVMADTLAPNVGIVATPSKTAAGEKVTIYVNASDNVGVKTITLQLQSVKDIHGNVTTINKTIALENGKAVYTLDADEYGTLTFVAIATDAQGNQGTATTTVQAIDPTDTEAPTIAITSHAQGSKIYGPVDIVGTVKDNEPGVSWTLKAIAMDNGKEVLIAEGTGNVENSVLGQFDTTMLRNGTWQIVLEAVDVGGNKSEKYFNVELEGEYKLGNFNMTFTDFDIMLSGLGITINRTYDTLNADVMGDFGYGWTLDIATTEISVVIGDGSGSQNGFSPYVPISDGTHITITLPDGTKEGFTFQAKGGGYGTGSMYEGMIPSQYYKPSWIPDVGTKSTLQADDTWLYPWGDGTYYQMDSIGLDQSDYSPANINGGFLTLTLRNGIDLMIDATNGKLYQAIDQNGNTLTFTDNSITHSSGKGVVFERDYQGRITAITGPDGGRVTYEYDTLGNLVASTDQSRATTRFTYLSGANDPEHYLDEVIDPLGRPAAKTEFDDSGRVKKVTDADGKTIEYEWNVEGKTQKVKDQLGYTSIIENDDRGNVIREVSPEGVITLRSYDSNDNMLTETKVVSYKGQEIRLTTTFAYDNQGNLVREVDHRGVVCDYTYNEKGFMTSVTVDGITARTVYDSSTGLPSQVIDGLGNITRYFYNDKGNVTSIVNSNGATIASSTYNSFGEIISSRSTVGSTVFMEYDVNGDCISNWYVDGDKKIVDRTFYDASRRVVRQARYVLPNGTLPNGKEYEDYKVWDVQFEYNAAGQIIKEANEKGLLTLNTFDVRGQKTETRFQTIDSSGDIIWVVQRKVYDAAGQVIAENELNDGATQSSSFGMIYRYDSAGRLVESNEMKGLIIEVDSYGKSWISIEGTFISQESTTYNNAGWILSERDSLGWTTDYKYNKHGDLIEERTINNECYVTVSHFVYDQKGRLVFSTEPHSAETGDIAFGTEYLYDESGRLYSTIRYKGSVVSVIDGVSSSIISKGDEIASTEMQFDAKGRLVSQKDFRGNITTYEYDSLDRVVAETSPEGLRTETIYNEHGRISEVKIISGNITLSTKYEHDAYGNIINTILPDGTSILAEYNANGDKLSETNAKGQTRVFTYDSEERVLAVSLPGGVTYEYEYDHNGNQTLIRDPLGHETRFTYDEDGNMLSRTLPLGFGADGILGTNDDTYAESFTERFEYNRFGEVVKHVSFEGIVTIFTYSDFGKTTSKTFYKNEPDFYAGIVHELWTYEYDGRGREVRVEQNGRITTTTYNPEGQIQSITSPEGTVSYEYNPWGQQTKVSLDSGESTEYTYDQFGRLWKVTADGKTTEYEYDGFGNLAKTKLPNGTVTSYKYDKMHRLLQLSNFVDNNGDGFFNPGDQGISQFTYELDELGRKVKAVEEFWADYDEDGIIDYLENSIDWEYDEMGRLVTELFDHYADENDQTIRWEYDLVGNRTKQIVDKGNDGSIDHITNYTYDSNDRLLTEKYDGQNDGVFEKETTYGYAKTHQSKKTIKINDETESISVFEYDSQGRLSVVTITSADKIERTSYAYDADGMRVSVIHEIDTDKNGVFDTKTKTAYLNDAYNHTGYTQVVKQTDYDASSNVIKEVTYVIGHERISQTVITEEGSHTLYFTRDGHGSTRVAIDALNAVLETYHFDAYGNAMGFDVSKALTEFLFSGEQFDAKIGQQYLRARYYDPATGRFNRLDPFFGNMHDPQSLHKYLYTHADPVNGIDPSGLMSLGSCMSAMASGMSSMAAKMGPAMLVLDRASTVVDVIQITTQLLFTGVVNPMQVGLLLTNVVPGASIFKRVTAFLPTLSRVTSFSKKLEGAADGLNKVWKGMNDNPGFSILFNADGKLAKAGAQANRLRERIGEVATGLVAGKLGLQSVEFTKRVHGIDGIFKKGGQWFIAEAKSGASKLKHTVDKGKQMSQKWIKESIKELKDTDPQLYKELTKAIDEGNLYSLVVRTPVKQPKGKEIWEATVGDPRYTIKGWDKIRPE